MPPTRLSALCAVLLLACPAHSEEGNGFRPLVEADSSFGWIQRGGDATYAFEGDEIVGTSVPNSPNSFLCTEETFGDFVLHFEFLCDGKVNSGVQFRSRYYESDVSVLIKGRKKHFPAGRVHGYQAEIDANKPHRMWMAGIYDEARRGWLFPGTAGGDVARFTEAGKALYRPGEWNHIAVECRGSRIRTWLNGQLRADFADDATESGFIALQVHSVGEKKDPREVRWRRIRIREL